MTPMQLPGTLGAGVPGIYQFSGQHLSYLDSLHYEFLSFALPLPVLRLVPPSDAQFCFKGSVQYLGSGDFNGMDASGKPHRDFSSYYTSYNLLWPLFERQAFLA